MKTIKDLKVGDKVLLRKDLKEGDLFSGGWEVNRRMLKYQAEPGEISEINNSSVEIHEIRGEGPGLYRWAIVAEMIDWERTTEINKKSNIMGENKEKTYSCTLSEWDRIINVACDNWKQRLINWVSEHYNYEMGKIIISKELIYRMIVASNGLQKEIIEGVFPKYFKDLEEPNLNKKWEDFKELEGYYVAYDGSIAYINKMTPDDKGINGVFAKESQCKAIIALAKLTHVLETYPENAEAKNWLRQSGQVSYVTKRDDELRIFTSNCYVLPFIFSTEKAASRFANENCDLLNKYFDNLIA